MKKRTPLLDVRENRTFKLKKRMPQQCDIPLLSLTERQNVRLGHIKKYEIVILSLHHFTNHFVTLLYQIFLYCLLIVTPQKTSCQRFSWK